MVFLESSVAADGRRRAPRPLRGLSAGRIVSAPERPRGRTTAHHPECPGDHAELERQWILKRTASGLQASRSELWCETPEFDAIADTAWGPGWRGRDAVGVSAVEPFSGHPQSRRLRPGDPLPAGWRWPTREEIERDRRLGSVASIPLVDSRTHPTLPWAVLVDVWLTRTRRLLRLPV